ncbi:MAG: YegS/Rv2252/BmrU family lipid kinase [Micropepsaceae bacterium]
MTIVAIVNPKSGGGRTAKRLPAISAALNEALGAVEIVQTASQGDGETQARAALRRGATWIVAIGGDGTLNEVVNGFFENGQPVNPDAVFSFAMSGSGGDFRKTFGAPGDVLQAIAALKTSTPRKLDIGRVSYLDEAGAPQVRHFVNIASFGLSGDVVSRVNRARIAKWFGGPFAFKWHSTMAALGFRPWRVRLTVDDAYDETLELSTAAIANGRYFGGGMMIAPNADTADGLFDVVVIAETKTRAMISRMNDIYTGKHLEQPTVTVVRGRRVTAAPADGQTAHVFAERDGEGDMRLPATFEILPAALTLKI